MKPLPGLDGIEVARTANLTRKADRTIAILSVANRKQIHETEPPVGGKPVRQPSDSPFTRALNLAISH